MAATAHYYTRFEEGLYYHVYNRTVDKKPMFRNVGNYQYFLRRYEHYLSPVISTYAYCLLGNHFHILFRVKDLSQFREIAKIAVEASAHDIVSTMFRKFFQSYAMAFNKQHQRVGTLFQTPFKRAFVSGESHFTQMIYYIHANPQKHGLTPDFRTWEWSSYRPILSGASTVHLECAGVLEWFGGKERYVMYHDSVHHRLQELNLDDDD